MFLFSEYNNSLRTYDDKIMQLKSYWRAAVTLSDVVSGSHFAAEKTIQLLNALIIK